MASQYSNSLQQFIQKALEEDVGEGDHSTLSCISKNAKGTALLKIKETGIIAGVRLSENIFAYVQPDISFTAFKKRRRKYNKWRSGLRGKR